MRCPQCGSHKTARSRFRSHDIRFALVLHFPARCHQCLERSHVNLVTWLGLRTPSRTRTEHGTA